MINRIIEELNVCLNNNCLLVALNMALTLPDICGKAEYPKIEKNGVRYYKWYNKYILKYEKTKITPNNFYLNGEIVWSLRNNTLHQATFNFDNDKIKFEDYELLFQDPNRAVLIGDYSISEICEEGQKNSKVVKKFLSISVLDLICKICHYAKIYYENNKEKFDFLKYKIVTINKRTRDLLKIKDDLSYEKCLPLEQSKTKSKWHIIFKKKE